MLPTTQYCYECLAELIFENHIGHRKCLLNIKQEAWVSNRVAKVAWEQRPSSASTTSLRHDLRQLSLPDLHGLFVR
jgi:hypothetical protein